MESILTYREGMDILHGALKRAVNQPGKVRGTLEEIYLVDILGKHMILLPCDREAIFDLVGKMSKFSSWKARMAGANMSFTHPSNKRAKMKVIFQYWNLPNLLDVYNSVYNSDN